MKTSRILLAAALFAALIFQNSAFADKEIVDGIEWQYSVLSGGAAEIVGQYDPPEHYPPCPAIPASTSGHLSIPETLGGHVVKHIGIQAFDGCDLLTGVSLPRTVETIGSGAFDSCFSISEITIPASVTNIDLIAFGECYSLQRVYFEGDAPTGHSIFGSYESNDAHSNCCVYVRHDSAGWGVDIPGMWHGVAIDWLDFTVRFDLGEKGTRIGGGELVQTATNKCAATAPIVSTQDNGWVFSGWDRPFSHVTNDLTITAQYAQVAENVMVHAGDLSSGEQWRADKVHLVATRMTIPAGVGLTVESGAVVKFMPDTELVVATGGSCVAKGVVFTHVNDDTVGGDTLMDGDSTSPRAGEYAIYGDVTSDEETEFRFRKLTVEVADVFCRQRYPWNGLVDIDFTVKCSDPTTNIALSVSAKDATTGRTLPVRTVRLENGAFGDAIAVRTRDLANGKCRLVWDAGMDNPGFVSDAVQIEVWAAVEGLYLVLDLSSGSGDDAVYPVSFLADVPAGGWSDEYKTTKLVLRRIEPGTFTMGCETNEVGYSYNNWEAIPHEVTITQPFYIGVFEVTQRQWELVMGNNPSCFSNPSYYAKRPVECVFYNMIRGSSSGFTWPTSSDVDETSFMGKLRARAIGRCWDLPTEAQWEYACRAGTTTALNNGKNLSNGGRDAGMEEVGRYNYNGGSTSGDYLLTTEGGTAEVGSYMPNAWGLYDMHGNVSEWCLDNWRDGDSFAASEIDPVGPDSAYYGEDYRVVRGGFFYWDAGGCRSAWREMYPPYGTPGSAGDTGLRLAAPANEWSSDDDSGRRIAKSGLFRLDVRPGAHLAADGETFTLAYSPRWGGAESCSVEADGMRLLSDAAEEGTLPWTARGTGLHALTFTAGSLAYNAAFTVLDESVVDHWGTLSSSETWTADKVHLVTAAVTVPNGVSLLIAPGAVVKFTPGAALAVASGATCVAKGAVFTHLYDDSVGGDTLGDGDARVPASGDYTVTGSVQDDEDTEWRYGPPEITSGTIRTDTCWRGWKTYRVTGNLTVASGTTLTVDAGAVVKVDPGVAISVDSGGALNALGTLSRPVVFTSIRDDAHGGDTNGDGDKTRPDDGDWEELRNSGGTLRLVHAKVLYGGYGQYSNQGDAAVRTSAGMTTLDGCEVAHSNMRLVGRSGGTVSARNCLLRDGRWGWDGAVDFVNGVVARCTTGASGGTAKNAVFWNCATVSSGTTVSHSIAWGETHPSQSGFTWADPLFLDPENGDFRIAANSPCIDAGDGTVARETDFYGRPRMNAAGVKDTGVPDANGICPDIGIYESDGIAKAEAGDFKAVSISVPASATVGSEIEIAYVVTNVGPARLSGTWRDGVSFVSAYGQEGGNVAVVSSATLEPNGPAATIRQRVRVPALSEGDWTVRVDLNAWRDLYECDTIDGANRIESATPVSVSIPALPLDETADGAIAQSVPVVRRFDVPDGEPHALRITAPPGSVVRVGVGGMPSASASGLAVGADGVAVVSLPAGKTAYVEVSGDRSGAVTLAPFAAGLSVLGVSLGTLPQSGEVTLAVSGLHFDSGCAVRLGGAASVTAESVRVLSAERIDARFDCSKLAAGTTYDLVVEADAATATLPRAVRVTGTPAAPKLRASLDMPSSLRAGRAFVFYVDYANEGNADMPSPVFTVSSDQMVFTTDYGTYTNSVKILGLGAEGSAGVLRPGESFRLPVKARVKATAGGTISYSLKAIAPGTEGWGDTLSLTSFFDEEWVHWWLQGEESEREAVAAAMGATWGEFLGKLGNRLTELGLYGLASSDFTVMAGEFANKCYLAARSLRVESDDEDDAGSLAAFASSPRTRQGASLVASVSRSAGDGDDGEIILHFASDLDKFDFLSDWVVPLNQKQLRERTARHHELLKWDNSNPGDVWIFAGGSDWRFAEWHKLRRADDLPSSLWHAGAETFILCHGNLHSVHSEWIAAMAAAIREKNPSSNILAVDWGDDSTEEMTDEQLRRLPIVSSVIDAVRNSSIAGNFIGNVVVDHLLRLPEFAVATALDIPEVARKAWFQLLYVGINPATTTIIGHSHGSHVAGNLAGRLSSGGTKVKRLVGMETSSYFSHFGVSSGEKFPASWNKSVAERAEFYKTSYGMSFGSTKLDGEGQVFGHYNFFVVPEKDNDGGPAYFEYQLPVAPSGDNTRSYLLNLDADTSEGRLNAYRHDQVELWFIDTIRNNGGKWDGLGFNWDGSDSCRKFGLPDGLAAKYPNRYHGVINWKTHKLECAMPDDWDEDDDGEWRYDEALLAKPDKTTGVPIDDLRAALAAAVEYRVGSLSAPSVLEPGGAKVSFTVRNRADNHGIDWGEHPRTNANSKNAKRPWERDFGGGVWLCRLGDGSLPASRKVSELRGDSDVKFQRIKSWKTNTRTKFTRPGQSKNESFRLDVPDSFFGHDIAEDGEKFLLVVGAGVSTKSGQNVAPVDYDGELAPDNNYVVREVTVKPSSLRISLDGTEYTDGDWASFRITRPQRYIPIQVSAVVRGMEAKSYQWVILRDEGAFENPTARSTTLRIPCEEGVDAIRTAVTVLVVTKDGKSETMTVMIDIVRDPDDEPDGDSFGGGSSTAPQSCDPNEMVGPDGAGGNHVLLPGEEATYTIFFENKSDADAPAQFVTVEADLSPQLDWSTFEMLDVGFGLQTDIGLLGKRNGTSDATMEGTNLVVRTEVAFDEKTGRARWFLRIVTPYGDEDGWPYANDPTGFLPPNDPDTHCGEGHITYRVKVRADAAPDARIDASATIVFDYNDPIVTDPAWWNTVATVYKPTIDLGDGTTVEIEFVVGQPYGELPTPKARAGYTFGGWYTGPNGTGRKVRAGDIVQAGDFGLHAYWIANAPATYAVAFDANGGTGKMAAQKIAPGATAKLSANKFKKGGCVFLGWAKTKTGAVAYANGASVKNLAAAGKSVTLYAKWAVLKYKVAYNKNGGKLPKKKKMAAQTMTYGKAAKLRKNVFTKKGCVFAGWATSKANAKKGVVAYKNAQSVNNLRADGGTTTLYAVWAKKTYKVKFYANGGKGKTVVQTFKYGKASKLKANKFKAPKGKKFAGWAKSKADAKAGKVAYKNKKAVKNLVTNSKTVKLYAVWKKK